MIVLNVTYKCKPDMREEFLEMIMTEGLDEASRAEAGNIKYDYYIPTEGSDDLLLLEKWQDAEALAEHGKQPHFARLGELKGTYVFETIIEKFIVNE
ncbi:MAG: antibiotic biosynthesis monooxygenase [Firmicutes bacterium]|nr:antibiotic biosynthesis monooxygenase [Bacillota bacterium]